MTTEELALSKKWFVITGPDDVGAEFASWAEAREYLRTLNQDARIIGPGCDPEGGDSPEYRYPVSLQTKRDEARAEVERLRDVLARIEALVWYQPDDDDDLVEAVRVMACERNEALSQVRGRQVEFAELHAEVERLRTEVERLRNADPGPSSSGCGPL